MDIMDRNDFEYSSLVLHENTEEREE